MGTCHWRFWMNLSYRTYASSVELHGAGALYSARIFRSICLSILIVREYCRSKEKEFALTRKDFDKTSALELAERIWIWIKRFDIWTALRSNAKLYTAFLKFQKNFRLQIMLGKYMAGFNFDSNFHRSNFNQSMVFSTKRHSS